MNRVTNILLCKRLLWVPLVLEIALSISVAQETPSARRAFVRDSLRQERLKARENAVKPTPTPPSPAIPATPSPEPVQPAVQNSPTPGPPQNDPASAVPKSSPASVPPQTETSQANPDSMPSLESVISPTLIVESLNVRDTEIRDVLSGLGSQFGVNILMDKDVAGPISVNLHKILLKDALRLITEQNGYRLQVMQGAVKVERPPAPLPPAPPQPNFKVEFAQNQLTVDLQKIPVEQVVRKLVEVTGKNIVLDRDARGDVSAFYKAMPFEKGLKVLAENNGFLIREKDGVISLIADMWNAGASGASAQGGGEAKGKMRVTFKDSLVNLEVSEAPLDAIISSISSQSGINTVVYGELKGSVTMKVSKLSIEQALQYLFRATEYTFWMRDGIYFIGPQSMQVGNNSKLIVLKHLKADEVLELLPTTLIQNAQLKVVKSQNAIMALGTYDVIDGISQYISQIDLPIPQILIEALVVDVDMDKIRNYGVDMFLGDYKRVPSRESIYPEVEQVLNRERSQSLINGIPGLRDIIELPKNFVARVEALEQEKVLKIRSRPQIATLNGSEATIKVGQTQYFLLKSETDLAQPGTVTTKTTERFEKIEANVTLTVTPFVTGKGEITCDIIPDFSEPEGSFDSRIPPTLNHRVLKSKVRLRDGETIVLGGLVKESVNRNARQFPILGSIPVLGWLFKNNNSVTTRSQLMIFVTPHIYYGKDAHVDPNTYLKKTSKLN